MPERLASALADFSPVVPGRQGRLDAMAAATIRTVASPGATPKLRHVREQARPAAAALFLLILLASAGDGFADDERPGGAWVETWLQNRKLVQEWFGFRDTLVGWGITPSFRYATDLQANVLGGQRRGEAYAGEMFLDVDLDLGRLAGLTGLTFHVSGDWSSGTDLSADIGNFFSVAQYFEGRRTRLYTMFLQQSFFNGHLDMKVGRIATGDDFLTSPANVSLVNSALNPILLAVQANVPSVTDEPHATWGGRVMIWPIASLYVAAGAYYSDNTLDELRTDGTEFGIDTKHGYFVIGEVGYLLNYEKGATGLPGRYRAGGYYDSNRYTWFSDPDRQEQGNYGFFLLGEQMVYRESGSGSAQGLTLFGAFVYAPRQRINQLPWFASAGVSYTGLIPGRDKDAAAFALYYGAFSQDLPGQTYEVALEWTYAIAVAPGLTVQPDIQYIMRPSGRSSIGNALVVGAQLSIQF